LGEQGADAGPDLLLGTVDFGADGSNLIVNSLLGQGLQGFVDNLTGPGGLLGIKAYLCTEHSDFLLPGIIFCNWARVIPEKPATSYFDGTAYYMYPA
jgi:hypothetical protein